jgi:hypothetical protein
MPHANGVVDLEPPLVLSLSKDADQGRSERGVRSPRDACATGAVGAKRREAASGANRQALAHEGA